MKKMVKAKLRRWRVQKLVLYAMTIFIGIFGLEIATKGFISNNLQKDIWLIIIGLAITGFAVVTFLEATNKKSRMKAKTYKKTFAKIMDYVIGCGCIWIAINEATNIYMETCCMLAGIILVFVSITNLLEEHR